MRIAWFTPFAKASAIGHFSQSIARVLSKTHEIDIWAPHAHLEGPKHDTRLRTIGFSSGLDAQSLAGYDLVVYNLGNYSAYHRDIFEVSQRKPGIAILHDFVYQHFFTSYYLVEQGNPGGYLNLMAALYGAVGYQVARRSLSPAGPRIWECEDVTHYPLFEAMIGSSLGVVAHSGFMLEKVRSFTSRPSAMIRLPFFDYPPRPAENADIRAKLGIPADRTLLVTIGHVNANKRVHRVLEALAGSPELARSFFYAVVGERTRDSALDAKLSELCQRPELRGSVKFYGYMESADLHALMSECDVFVNLRTPTIEGASASLVEEFYFGKPVIVSDAGCYHELPDDSVWKIPPESEIPALTGALRSAMDPAERKRRGERAAEFGRLHFSLELYAELLENFVNTVLWQKPVTTLVDKVAEELLALGAAPTSLAASAAEVVDWVVSDSPLTAQRGSKRLPPHPKTDLSKLLKEDWVPTVSALALERCPHSCLATAASPGELASLRSALGPDAELFALAPDARGAEVATHLIPGDPAETLLRAFASKIDIQKHQGGMAQLPESYDLIALDGACLPANPRSAILAALARCSVGGALVFRNGEAEAPDELWRFAERTFPGYVFAVAPGNRVALAIRVE